LLLLLLLLLSLYPVLMSVKNKIADQNIKTFLMLDVKQFTLNV